MDKGVYESTWTRKWLVIGEIQVADLTGIKTKVRLEDYDEEIEREDWGTNLL